MIRINLLPEAKRQPASAEGGQLWGVVYLLSAFAWGVVLFLVYLNYSGVLEEQQVKNEELKAQIERAKAQTENIGDIEAKLAKSKQLEDVVNGLQTARQGPARVLMELSAILSEGKGPKIPPEELEALRRDNPLSVFNAGWDVRRLWIESFTEAARKCKIKGTGKSNEDVAEFLRRLTMSKLFKNVVLESTSASSADKTGLPEVTFLLNCEVKY
jgi:type IV pilus assembly protein PilN